MQSTKSSILQGTPIANLGTTVHSVPTNLSATDTQWDITVRNDTSAPIGNPLIIEGFQADFRNNPTGTIHCYNDQDLREQLSLRYFPSSITPLDVVWMTDGQTGVSVYSKSERGKIHLWNVGWAQDGIISNPPNMQLWTTHTLAPKESCIISFIIRETTDLSMEGLLSGYKTGFSRKIVPAPQRSWIQFASVDKSLATPTNPGGYNGDERRIDTAAGVTSYFDFIDPLIKYYKPMGVMFWEPGGWEEEWYPIDYDVNLQRISATWPLVIAALKQRNMIAGLCVRLDKTRLEDGSEHATDPNNTQDMAIMVARLKVCQAMGIEAYYCDSFGLRQCDVQILIAARSVLGPEVPIFTEYTNTEMLQYADVYCEHSGGAIAEYIPGAVESLRYICTTSAWLCMNRDAGPLPAGFIPLIQDGAGVPA